MSIITFNRINTNIPPQQFGDVYLIVKQNSTTTITQAMLLSMSPEYKHRFDIPMGGINIVAGGSNPISLITLSSGNNSILGNISNNNSFIKYNPPVAIPANIIDGNISRDTIVSNQFKFIANNTLGQDFVYFTCSAYNNGVESEYTTTTRKLYFKVVSAINKKPSSIGNNALDVPEDTLVTLTMDLFILTTPPYTDPEGDAPLKVKILQIPSFMNLLFRGLPVTLNQEIMAQDIDNGELKCYYDSGAADSIDTLKFDIADTGSGIYSGL